MPTEQKTACDFCGTTVKVSEADKLLTCCKMGQAIRTKKTCWFCSGNGQIRITEYAKMPFVKKGKCVLPTPEKTDIIADCPICNGTGKGE